jgi:hypothetical protein
MNQHFSDADLIDRLYEVGRADAHLDECEACRERWLAIQSRRARLRVDPDVPAALLARQREAVEERLGGATRRRWQFGLAPAAALSMAVLGILLWRPAAPPRVELTANETRLPAADFYSEIYTMVESPAPWAAEPIEALFEQ